MKGPRWVIDIAELLDLPLEERAAWIRKLWREEPSPGERAAWIGKLRLESPLSNRFPLDERQILQALAQEHGFGFVDLKRVICHPNALASVPPELVTKFRALPVKKEEMTIWCAFSDFPSRESLDSLEAATQCRIVPVFARESELNETIYRHFGD